MPKSGKYSYFKITLVVAIAIAILLRIIFIDSREFWYDEVLSLLLSTGQKSLYRHPSDTPVLLSDYQSLLSLPLENSIGDILHTGEKFLKGLVGEPHPPLFYIGQHLWLRLFGNSVGAMRSLPVLYSIGTIFCSYGLGRRLLGDRGGLLLAALLGLNPFYLYHSLNVRMYCSLVFWTVLSGWAILELIGLNAAEIRIPQNDARRSRQHELFWSFTLIVAVAAGFMTFYYFAFWVASLGVLVLLQDRKYWLKHALRLSLGLFITTPWLLWGTRQQLNNADLGRFKVSSNIFITAWKHIQGVLHTLGTHLIVGDWASITPPLGLTLAGIGAIAVLVGCSLSLWRNNRRQILLIALTLGIVPLAMMVAVDVVSGKYTVGFGMGRSAIFILPGCLLLVAAWIDKVTERGKTAIATSLIIVYLSINLADFSLRSRWMFHQIADIIEQESAQPTLIVMNSHAWGHVMRLVYYLPRETSVMLLAQRSNKLIPALKNTLATESQYKRILWLDSDRPVWGTPTTPGETQQIEQILNRQFQLVEQQRLLGTWELDNFTARLYRPRIPS